MTLPCIYQFRFSPGPQSERPILDYESPKSEIDSDSWCAIDRIVKAELPSEIYSPIHLAATGPGADIWDSYSVGWTFGLFSQVAIDLLGRYMEDYFEFLPAFVNDRPFYFLRVVRRLDCVDLANCVIEYFPSDPTAIMGILKYRFHKEKISDEAFFPIPERATFLFATETIKRTAESAGLRGFHFVDAETQGDA